jgi:glycosyltransferase involved in cell wall biosynthesis
VRAKAVRAALRAVDLALAGAAALAGGCVLLARRGRRADAPPPSRPRLMAIDSMYSLDVLQARQAEHLVTWRDLGGYFEHVWSVHPFIGVDSAQPDAMPAGPPVITKLGAAHTMIEGKAARLAALARLPYLNFVLAQMQLLVGLDRIVRRQSVAIIRGDPYYHGLMALVLGRLNGRRVELRVMGNHDAIYDAVGLLAYPRLFRWRAVEKRVAHYTLSRADSVVVASDDNGGFALRNGAHRERLAYAANSSMVNPVHLEAPAARAMLDDEFGLGDRPVVAFVARLVDVKHPEDVVLSVAAARRRIPRLAAVIVGDGPMRGELEELCRELGVAEDVVFAGERDQRWIARLLTQSTVVAAPLAGLSLVESALSGTPIVGYDVEWHSEFLTAGQEAIFVAYRDTDALAAAICSVVEEPEMGERLSGAARARGLQIMDPAKLIADERALADELLARAAPPTSSP